MSRKPDSKLIDENDVPGRTRKSREDWLKRALEIPKGKALIVTEEDTHLSLTTVKWTIDHYVKQGKLPANYYTARRKEGDKKLLYIVHSAQVDADEE